LPSGAVDFISLSPIALVAITYRFTREKPRPVERGSFAAAATRGAVTIARCIKCVQFQCHVSSPIRARETA